MYTGVKQATAESINFTFTDVLLIGLRIHHVRRGKSKVYDVDIERVKKVSFSVPNIGQISILV